MSNENIVYIHQVFNDPESKIIAEFVKLENGFLSVKFPLLYDNDWTNVSTCNGCFRDWTTGGKENIVNYNVEYIADWGYVRNQYVIDDYLKDVDWFVNDKIKQSKQLEAKQKTRKTKKTTNNIVSFADRKETI